MKDIGVLDGPLPAWELLDVHPGSSRVLASRSGDRGCAVFLVGGPSPVPVAAFDGETVRFARFDRSGGLVLAAAEDARGHQRIIALEQQAASGDWKTVRALELPPGAVLDLDPELGILFALTTDPSGGVDVVRFDPQGRTRTEVYGGGGWIFSGSLSPDGTRAALLRVVEGRADTELLVCRVGGGEPARELMAHDVPAGMGWPSWLPGGESFLLSSNLGCDYAGVARVDVRSGGWDYVWHTDYDAGVLLPLYSDLVLIDENVDGATRITQAGSRAEFAGPLVAGRRYLLPGHGMVRFGRRPVVDRDGWLYCTYTDHARPAGVWRLSVDAPAQQLSPVGALRASSGSADADRPPLPSAPERVFLRADDGVTVPVLVWPGRKGEALHAAGVSAVILHGGPKDQWRHQYYPLISALRREGVTVLTPDLRGSTGFGKNHSSIDAGIRHLDALRDLAAVHAYLAGLGLNPYGATLIGYSFGGYQTLAAVSRPGAPWAAAVAVSGVSDPLSYLESVPRYRRPQRELTYGSLEHDHEVLKRNSPVDNADAVRAPLLLIHGERDSIVPLAQAEAMAAAVRAEGGEATLRTFPDEGHQIRRPQNQIAKIGWITEFIRGRPGQAGGRTGES